LINSIEVLCFPIAYSIYDADSGGLELLKTFSVYRTGKKSRINNIQIVDDKIYHYYENPKK